MNRDISVRAPTIDQIEGEAHGLSASLGGDIESDIVARTAGDTEASIESVSH